MTDSDHRAVIVVVVVAKEFAQTASVAEGKTAVVAAFPEDRPTGRTVAVAAASTFVVVAVVLTFSFCLLE